MRHGFATKVLFVVPALCLIAWGSNLELQACDVNFCKNEGIECSRYCDTRGGMRSFSCDRVECTAECVCHE